MIHGHETTSPPDSFCPQKVSHLLLAPTIQDSVFRPANLWLRQGGRPLGGLIGSRMRAATYVVKNRKNVGQPSALRYEAVVVRHLFVKEYSLLHVKYEISREHSTPPNRAVQELLIQPMNLHASSAVIKERQRDWSILVQIPNQHHGRPRGGVRVCGSDDREPMCMLRRILPISRCIGSPCSRLNCDSVRIRSDERAVSYFACRAGWRFLRETQIRLKGNR